MNAVSRAPYIYTSPELSSIAALNACSLLDKMSSLQNRFFEHLRDERAGAISDRGTGFTVVAAEACANRGKTIKRMKMNRYIRDTALRVPSDEPPRTSNYLDGKSKNKGSVSRIIWAHYNYEAGRFVKDYGSRLMKSCHLCNFGDLTPCRLTALFEALGELYQALLI